MEAKRKLRLSTADTTHDEELLRQIQAATSELERATGRALITQTWLYSADSFPPQTSPQIQLKRRPIQSITSIKYQDADDTEQTLDPADYVLDLSRREVHPAYNKSWPSVASQPNAVKIEFVAGYGDNGAAVDGLLKETILCQAAAWFYGNSADAKPYQDAYDRLKVQLEATYYES